MWVYIYPHVHAVDLHPFIRVGHECGRALQDDRIMPITGVYHDIRLLCMTSCLLRAFA